MNRIGQTLSLQATGHKLLVPFLTVGYPTVAASLDLVKAAVDAGSDFVELGMPFSDPLADGPEIQHSSQVALGNGVRLRSILRETVPSLRQSTDIPLILMGYYNPLLSMGVESFIQSAYDCGVDGLIIPDLPCDEALTFTHLARMADISTVFLVAPTSSHDRIMAIDKASSDFVYAVTVTGVTGAGRKFSNETIQYLRQLRSSLSKPFVAGFGVSSASDARRLARHSDGVVIGSALIRIIRSARTNKSAVSQVYRFLSSVREAI